MNRHRQGYIDNCPLRNDFLEVLCTALKINYCQETARKEEKFMLDIKSGRDSVDLTLHYIYYPLPYVKEIFIVDWKGGWETEQSSLHLQYWDGKWKVRKSILKTECPDTQHYKKSKREISESSFRPVTYIERRLQNGENYTSDNDIIKEIIQYFDHIDSVVAKSLLRSYNLNQLI